MPLFFFFFKKRLENKLMSSWLCWPPRQRPFYGLCMISCTCIYTRSVWKGKVCIPCYSTPFVHLNDWLNDIMWEAWLFKKDVEKRASKTSLLKQWLRQEFGRSVCHWRALLGLQSEHRAFRLSWHRIFRGVKFYGCRRLLIAHLRGPRSLFPTGVFF